MRGRATVLPTFLLTLLLLSAGCLQRPTPNPGIIVASVTSGPNNLDPRVGTDDVSQKLHQLMYDNLMELDDHLRVVPRLAERLDHPDPLTYIVTLRRGVLFQDGHELTSTDVVYTFTSLLDPAFTSAKKGAYRDVQLVDALDDYTVAFHLKRPFASFPINLVIPIVAKGAGADLNEHPMGTGPYRFVRYLVDDHIELSAFDQYFQGRPKNDGIILKIVPDEVMRGLEARKGTIDVIVNDISPDIAFQLKNDPHLQMVEGPGADYQYIGLNLRDPILSDVRVRHALAYAIDRRAIVDSLRRGLAVPATGMLPPMSWALAPDLDTWPYDPERARQLLDEAGYTDPDGDGPKVRFSLTLKVSNIEFNRLQATVVQQNLQQIGIALDVRTYEFATLYADVVSGNFQLFFLQWTAGSLADPDILRRTFHSTQTPPIGFNRGGFNDPRVDALLDEAGATEDAARRLALYQDVQRLLHDESPYNSLWHKTNFVIAQKSLSGIRLNPQADLLFLKDVTRHDAS
ncbi:MAG: ABC transporter substrate-binding protein [Acidobacteriaceae bacterium]|jgi:peptide/nickel transport system substrate-binding protein|nr:ABC transporter substrate-binding protein [Acidobacteriaceae bacterium]